MFIRSPAPPTRCNPTSPPPATIPTNNSRKTLQLRRNTAPQYFPSALPFAQYDTVHTTFPRHFRRGFVCRSNRRGTTNYTPRRLAAHDRRTRLLANLPLPPHGALPPRKRSPPLPRRRNSQTYGISDNTDLFRRSLQSPLRALNKQSNSLYTETSTYRTAYTPIYHRNAQREAILPHIYSLLSIYSFIPIRFPIITPAPA